MGDAQTSWPYALQKLIDYRAPPSPSHLDPIYRLKGKYIRAAASVDLSASLHRG